MTEIDQTERAMRFGADMICLWCLCDQADCRRARACRGDVRLCGLRVAEWLEAIGTHREAEPGFFEIEMRLETKAELRAYHAWRKALARVLSGVRVDPRSTAYAREALKRQIAALHASMADERKGSVSGKRRSEEGGKS